MRRFATLDALRGVAALAVLLWHSPGHPIAPYGGYLAVDLFFGISGFVMALTYEERLRQGMPVRRFMALRAARLWPMLFLAALPAVLLGGAWPGLLVLVPDPRDASLYPMAAAYWSLLMEAAAYLAFALVAPRITSRGLVAVMAVCGLALTYWALTSPARLSEFGPFWSTVPHGLARVGYSFSFGVLAYRIRAAQGLPQVTSGFAWLLPLAFGMLAYLVPIPGQLEGLLGILLALPPLLWLATKWEVPHLRLADRLSNMSYPLYCVHMQGIAFLRVAGIPTVVSWLLLIALSLVLDRWWDRPMRRMCRMVAEGHLRSLKTA